jgi:hypothetical protein
MDGFSEQTRDYSAMYAEYWATLRRARRERNNPGGTMRACALLTIGIFGCIFTGVAGTRAFLGLNWLGFAIGAASCAGVLWFALRKSHESAQP